MITTHRLVVGLAIGWLTMASAPAAAQEGDPPSRIARLAYAEGTVSLQPAGTEDWVEAPLNRPLTTGDSVWLDQDSRTELELDGSTLRLVSGSELSFVNLGDEITQVQLASGTLLLRVRELDDRDTYEVDTPNLAFSILRPGVYRISVDASGGSTTVIVRIGQGEVTGNGAAYTLRTGDEDVFSGTDALSVAALPPSDPDDFEAWSQQRDRRWDRFVSAQYVSSDVVGYEDLDDYGSWGSTPEYGNVWYPTDVEQGWAPYHSGYWSYIAPWGYTWVDAKPWGFAPFHYGRWVWTGGAWGWIPSPPRPERGPYVRPVYAPALVAWVGAGAGVAWFALGPREVYVPSYRVSADYMRNINVSNTTVNRTTIDNVYNTTIINNRTVNVTYINRGAPGAVTATSAQAFAGAQAVQKNRIAFDPAARHDEPVRALAPNLVPAKQSVLGPSRASAVPPATLQSRSIVARTPPPPPALSFDKRQEAMRGNGGRPLSTAEVQQIRPNAALASRAPVRVLPHVAPVALANAPRAPAAPVAPAAVAVHGAVPVPAAAPAKNGQSPASTAINRPVPAPVHVNELPAPSRPASPNAAETALEREHLQQQQALQNRQDQERQRLQQQQELEHQQQQLARQQQELEHQQESAREQAAREQAARQQAARQADQTKAQELERQHQLQTQQLQQQHIEEQQALAARQREQVEQQNQRRPPPPKPQEPKKNP